MRRQRQGARTLRIRCQSLDRRHATSLEGRQFAPYAKAIPGYLYDGETLVEINPDMENTIGNGIERILADASGQERRMTPTIRPVRFD